MNREASIKERRLDFLAGGGEMGERMRAHDWSTSPLGRPEHWSESLRAVVALMINSKYPMFVAWGPDLAFLYNDGYIPIFGAKHPHTLGLPFKQVWSEIWDDISPLVERALNGEATFNEDLHLVMERHGYPEDTWYSFSYSPVRDESGAIAGMFCACTETTQKVLAERSLSEREERLRAFLNATSDVVYRMNADWTVMERLDGRGFVADTNDPSTTWLEAYIAAEDRPMVLAAIQEAIRTKSTFELEHRVRRVDGTLGWASSRAIPLLDQDGEIVEWFGAASDVSARHEAEVALTESETRFRNMADHAPVMLWVTEPGGSCSYLNKAWYDFTGQSEEEALGFGWLEVVHPDDKEESGRIFLEANARHEPFLIDYRLRRSDGNYRWAIDAGSPRFGPEGDFLGYIGSVIDIHDRKREEQLGDARNRILELAVEDRPIEESLGELVKVIETEAGGGMLGSILLLDEDRRRLLHGAAPSLPDAYNQAIHGVEIGPAVGSCGTAAHSGEPVFVTDITTDPLWKDFKGLAGEHGLRACWSIPIYGTGGEVLGTFAMYYREPRQPSPDDLRLVEFVTRTASLIIERHDAAKAVRESERRFRSVFEAAGVGMIEVDGDWRIRGVNAAYARIAGRPESELLGAGSLSFTHPDDLDRSREAMRSILDGRTDRASLEKRYIRPDGEVIWVRSNLTRISSGAQGDRFLKVVEDISGRKATEDALRKRSEEFFALADNIPSLAWMAYADGHIFWYNRRWYEYTGTSPESQEGWGWESVHDPEWLPAVVERWTQSLATGEPFEMIFPLKGADGSYRPFLTRIVPIRDEAGAIARWFGTNVDVGEQVEAERQLREQRETLETLNRTGSALAAELDVDSIVQMVNNAGVEITGADFGAFFYNVLDERGESYMLYALSGADRSAFEGFPMPRNTEVFAPTFSGASTVRSDDITKDPRYGRNAPRKGMPEGHLPVRSYLAVPVIGRSGEALGGLFFGHSETARFTEAHEKLMLGIAAQAAVAIDNARLYQAVSQANETLEQRVQERTNELETANEALRQAQKMEAIGQLTGGIAHDFNNMLTVIRGSADVLQRGQLDDAKRQRYIQAIADTSDRAARLTSQLLAFARRQALKPEVFEVSERVHAVGDMLRTVLGARIALEIEGRCADCFVETDAAQFETALVNMAVNARDAMAGEGKVLIEIDVATSLTSFARPPLDFGYVTISVTDTGHGIAADDLDRIFEPFFTTKETGKGTGLGLSQVYGFAKQSGGEIKVRSEVGRGTTFIMYLPRVPAQKPVEQASAEPSRSTKAEGCVLIVEDNDEVGVFAEHALGDLGFKTRRAATAAEALALLESGSQFDVVFSDIVMPGQNGIDLARELRARWPTLPVVLTTGYSDALASQHEHSFPVLHKPYSLETLSAALGEVLKV